MPGHPIRLVLLPAAAFLSVAIAKDSNNNNRRQTDFIGVTRELGGWSTDVKKNAEQSKNSLNMVQVHPPPKVIYDAPVMQSMLSPMESNEFFETYYMKEPVHIHRANAIPKFFRELLPLSKFDELVQLGQDMHWAENVMALKNAKNSEFNSTLPNPQPSDVAGSGDYTKRLLANGATLRVNMERLEVDDIPNGMLTLLESLNVMLGGVNITEKKMERWEGFEDYTPHMFTSVHVYATGPHKGARGLKPHTDPYDVFVLQLEGVKEWTVCTPTLIPETRNSSMLHSRRPTCTSSAETAELHLQDQQKSDMCTFYSDVTGAS